MQNSEEYLLNNLNLTTEQWISIRDKLPLSRGQYGKEVINTLVKKSRYSNEEITEALEELFNDVYEDLFYPEAGFSGFDSNFATQTEDCSNVKNNLIFWNTFYNNGLEILTDGIQRPLREYQKELVEDIMLNPYRNLQVLMAGGGGKTFIQAEITENFADKDGGAIIASFVPKILLGFQQLSEYYERLNEYNNKDYRFVFVSSANVSNFFENVLEDSFLDITPPDYELQSTTDSEIVEEEYQEAKKNGQNLVIVSTYHSSERVREAIDEIEGKSLDLAIADEAHHVATDPFYIDADETNANSVQFQNLFSCPYHYYTATPRYRVDGKGMNNESLFGPVVSEVSARKLIEEGYLVPIKENKVANFQSKNDEFYDDLRPATKDIYLQHNKDTEYPAQLLVTCPSRTAIDKIASYLMDKDLPDDPTICEISTSDGDDNYGAYIGGEEVSDRAEWVQRVRNMGGNMIILHHDIVGEGIDVPTLTGLTFLHPVGASDFLDDSDRNSGLIKLMQIIYRVMRTFPDSFDHVKKSAQLYIPELSDDVENFVENQEFNAERFKDVMAHLLMEIQNNGILPGERYRSNNQNSTRGQGGSNGSIEFDDDELDNIREVMTTFDEFDYEDRWEKMAEERKDQLRSEMTDDEIIDSVFN